MGHPSTSHLGGPPQPPYKSPPMPVIINCIKISAFRLHRSINERLCWMRNKYEISFHSFASWSELGRPSNRNFGDPISNYVGTLQYITHKLILSDRCFDLSTLTFSIQSIRIVITFRIPSGRKQSMYIQQERIHSQKNLGRWISRDFH